MRLVFKKKVSVGMQLTVTAHYTVAQPIHRFQRKIDSQQSDIVRLERCMKMPEKT